MKQQEKQLNEEIEKLLNEDIIVKKEIEALKIRILDLKHVLSQGLINREELQEQLKDLHDLTNRSPNDAENTDSKPSD